MKKREREISENKRHQSDLMNILPPDVNALLMEDALRSVWLPSRPAMDPETEVAMGPRQEENNSHIDLLKRKH